MILNNFLDFFKDHFRVFADKHCEMLTCKKCGRKYASIGEFDIGICQECQREMNFIGGPLDDDSGSKTETS